MIFIDMKMGDVYMTVEQQILRSLAKLRRQRRRELKQLVIEHNLFIPQIPQTSEEKVKAIQSGDYDFNLFAQENMGLAVQIANNTYVKYHDLDDKINIALEGLYQAVHDYNPEKGVEFSKYASTMMARFLYREHTRQTRSKRGGNQADLAYDHQILTTMLGSQPERQAFNLEDVVFELLLTKMEYKTPLEQQVALAHFSYGLSITEIADRTGVKRYTIQGYYVKLRRQLARLLTEERYLDR